MKDIYIIGAGGFGREVADTIHSINSISPKYNIAGFIDDNQSLHNNTINGIRVLGGIDYLKNTNREQYAIIAIAAPDIKELLSKELHGHVLWESIVHPTAVVSKYAEIGEGILIQSNVFVSSNTLIGNHVHVNVNSSIGHDTILEDYVSVMCLCDITGNVTLKTKSYVASSVSVIPGITVGESAKLGAGAVVMKDVNAGVTMHGHMATEAEK